MVGWGDAASQHRRQRMKTVHFRRKRECIAVKLGRKAGAHGRALINARLDAGFRVRADTPLPAEAA
jgi:hypothetical protein